MHVSQRYRDSAAECLLAAEEASQPHRRKLHLSMAISWLSLARKYEAIEHLFQEEPERLPYSKEPTTGPVTGCVESCNLTRCSI
jgi:hypothetical protein